MRAVSVCLQHHALQSYTGVDGRKMISELLSILLDAVRRVLRCLEARAEFLGQDPDIRFVHDGRAIARNLADFDAAACQSPPAPGGIAIMTSRGSGEPEVGDASGVR